MFERMFALWPDFAARDPRGYHLGVAQELEEARNLDSEVLAEIRHGGTYAGRR